MLSLHSSTSARRDFRAADDQGRTIALRVLGFVARDAARLNRFLSGAAITAADFLRHPEATAHLVDALDFLIADESLLQAFTRTTGISMEALYETRRAIAPRPSLIPALVHPLARP